jgi:hypothetical protein
MAKLLIVAGLVLIAAGLLLLALGRIGLPLGRLPGDLAFRGKHITVFAPLGTCILLSVLLSLILFLVARFRR